MDRNVALAERIREVLLNGHWIANTNFKDQLQDIHWSQAIRKTDGFNTIAMLTYHVNYYVEGLLNAFENNKLEISDKYSFDLPPIASEADWKNTVTTFLENSGKFAAHVEKMNDQTLDAPFFDVKYGTVQRNIEGVIEHSYYHLGQIVLIRKLTEIPH